MTPPQRPRRPVRAALRDPNWWVRCIGLLRDILVVLIGLGTFASRPPSLAEFGVTEYLSLVWSAFLVAGGLTCCYSLLRGRDRVEIVGTFTVASGFVVWAIAAGGRQGADVVSYTVATVFLVLALCSLLRGLVVATGMLTSTRGG